MVLSPVRSNELYHTRLRDKHAVKSILVWLRQIVHRASAYSNFYILSRISTLSLAHFHANDTLDVVRAAEGAGLRHRAHVVDPDVFCGA